MPNLLDTWVHTVFAVWGFKYSWPQKAGVQCELTPPAQCQSHFNTFGGMHPVLWWSRFRHTACITNLLSRLNRCCLCILNPASDVVRSCAAMQTSGYNVAYVGNIAFTVAAKQLERALEGCKVAKVCWQAVCSPHFKPQTYVQVCGEQVGSRLQ